MKACPHLDGKHCVFGRVIDGMEVARKVEASEALRATAVIDDCGEVRGSGVAALSEDLAGPGLGDRPAKRRRADVASVQLLHIVKKHAGSREPVDAKGQAVKATKGRAALALANIRKKPLGLVRVAGRWP